MGLLYTKMKVFHFKDKVESLPLESEKILPPVQIRIKPTNVCAHNCWYCAYRAENLQLGKDMVHSDHIPREKMREIVEDIIDMGVKSVTFSGGGDPFHYPYLLETVEALAKSPVKFATLTHGSRLQGKVAEIFAHHGTWVRISMDGWDDASYAKYRRIAVGEFTKVLKNISDFKNMKGKCYLGVVLIIDKDNGSHVYELIKKLKDTGVDSVKLSPCIVDNDSQKNNAYHAAIFGMVKEQITRAMEEFADERFEIYDTYHTLDEKFRKDYKWCPYLQIVPVIGADCNVYACHDKAYNLEEGLIGSIQNVRFKDFWMSGKEKYFKINPSVVCNHHCVVNTNNKLVLEYLNADREHLDFV